MSDDTPDPKPEAPSDAQLPTLRPAGTSPTPHDSMFQVMMSDPARAQAFLRDHLPASIKALLSDRPPRIVDGSFVDENLRGSQADLLLEVETKAGKPALVYVLVEHKSTSDPGVLLQLAGYMIRIWVRWARGKAKRLRSLPPIIPVVVYSGSARWTVPGSLKEMIDSSEPDLVSLPVDRYNLLRIAGMPVGELSGNVVLRAGFVVMTRRTLEHPEEVVAAILRDPSLKEFILSHIFQTDPKAEPGILIDSLGSAGVEDMEEIVETIASRLRAEGEAHGFARGEARGIVKGEARGIEMGMAEGRRRDLTRLLERRFGPLPRDITQRIAAADHDRLDRWLDRMLDADGLAAVFGD